MAAPSTGGAPNARSTAAAAAGSEEASTHDTSLASPPTATASTEAAAATLGSATRTAAWAVAAGAVVGLGAGVLLQLAAVSSNSDFNNSCYLDVNGNPASRPGVSSGHCADLRNSWSTDRTWSLVGYVGGAALAVTAGVLFWSSRPAAGHDLRARLMCVPGLEGISCGGVF
jgi:hypothetical protein